MNMNLIFVLLLALGTDIPDGSLLYIENGNKTVQRYTDSTITHVALIIKIDNEPWVYEATSPKVRKIKLSDYYLEVEKHNKKKKKEKDKWKIWFSYPKRELFPEESKKLRDYLDSQVGRKYSVNSYLNEEPGRGIHCCELVGNALRLINFKYTDRPCTDSPIDVWRKTKTFYFSPFLSK